MTRPWDPYMGVIKVVGLVIFGLVIFFGIRWVSGTRAALKEANQTIEQSNRTGAATSGITGDIAAAGGAAQEDQRIVIESRVTYQQQYREAKQNDQAIAVWADAPVPERLRELARERRESRERLGCVGAGCGSPDGGAQPDR